MEILIEAFAVSLGAGVGVVAGFLCVVWFLSKESSE